jgi:nickel superoxide dismutase
MTIMLIFFTAHHAIAHCQIPCGIYDDQLRIELMEEHAGTIKKSIHQIRTATVPAQQVRWTLNRENHADELTEIVVHYFLTQRIKKSSPDYEKTVVILHQMMQQIMRCKQNEDIAQADQLLEMIHAFEHLYLKDKAKHSH